jgi:hypothetical protein
VNLRPPDLDVSSYAYLADDLSNGLAEIKTWLSGFDPSGFLVLNYGEICSVINPYSLERERSVEETWKFLRSLKEGNYGEADGSLKTLMRKWDDIRNYASGSLDDSTLQ